MFEELKRAWREAVDNFWHELNGADGDAADLRTAVDRELAAAVHELERVDTDLERTRRDRDADLQAESVCRRREALARDIGDTETARVAAEFALRHAERAGVLAQKAEALAAERALRARELDAMRAAIREITDDLETAPEPSRVKPAQEPVGGSPDDAADEVFRDLDRRARERAAQVQLEELKRRMQ